MSDGGMTQSGQAVLYGDLARRVLRPRSIAFVGVSARAGSPGRAAVAVLDQSRFAGDVHLVGRSGGELDGRPVHPSLDAIPEGVDLAVLALPAEGVADAVEACIARRVGSVVVFASGFAEAGDAARDAQAALSRRCEEARLGMMGPNCLGFTNYVDGIDVGFIPGPPPRVPAPNALPTVAIVAQSGGLMGHAFWALEARGLPIAYRISTGNEAGLGLADFVAALADDPAVNVIALYAEHLRRPAAFLRAVALARAAGKSVVMFHTGRGARAQAAAASHTGALASDYATMAVLAARAGVLVVDTLEEWIDCAELLARRPLPPVADPAVITTSGAFCAIAHDCFEAAGIDLPPISPATEALLAPRLPVFTPPSNPLDLTTQAAFDMPLTADVARAFADDPTIGSIAIAVPAIGRTAVQWLTPLVDVVATTAKPILVTALGEGMPMPEDFEALARSQGILLSRSPERALRTLAAVTRYGRALARPAAPLVPLAADLLPALRPGAQPEWLGKAVLGAIGVRCPDGALAADADAAVEIANRIGYPVVLKVQAAELAHKTEIGGVVLNLGDDAAVRGAYAGLVARVAEKAPGTVLDGILVEAMASKGLELVIGAKRDPHWGTVLLVGLGGVLVEALGDVRLLPDDLPAEAIVDELRKLKSARLLEAFRGAPAPDVAAVAEAVAAVGRLMRSRPDIREVDINPLLALPAGEGAIALDALIVAD